MSGVGAFTGLAEARKETPRNGVGLGFSKPFTSVEFEHESSPLNRTVPPTDSKGQPQDYLCTQKLCANIPTHATMEEMEFERGIWAAAVAGDMVKLKRILEKDSSSLNARDNYGYTALAFRGKQWEVVQWLSNCHPSLKIPVTD
ncbi:unnamed protein product [Dicrocoelium dendriticum]|nr:unnamed protein product [Dicrocoelium dendriticum]